MEMIFGAFYAIGLVSGFCLLCSAIEWLFDFIYRHVPSIRKRVDTYFESVPDWDED